MINQNKDHKSKLNLLANSKIDKKDFYKVKGYLRDDYNGLKYSMDLLSSEMKEVKQFTDTYAPFLKKLGSSTQVMNIVRNLRRNNSLYGCFK